ncbi:HEAT repeat domain-containing protein [Nocardiopsis sp. RSe5-2]|uniref:HEAT repeat domain-containing protein n=1 Tax=Nocardiopsis endophytica TaxID=3018445 RepID=A0ABT4UCR1_9ACTN|nr:HEAT repeat domain-containing protein [Nocardiopsis endophytica]MDA2814687.1 HEAT repeat domain-containing protein [Nocardiopsis endophytica]
MFEGLEDIPWADMEHAYGPADEMPDLLRGLVDPDPAERETALDGMYGAVHHQGDVYECTLAAVPFLVRIAGAPGVPGRAGVLGLLASIGGADWDDGLGDEGHRPAEDSTYARAERAVAAEVPLFQLLLADGDPAVRAAACRALTVPRSDGPCALEALRERWEDEDDEDVRAVIVTAVGRIGAGTGRGHTPDALRNEAGAWLAGVAAGGDGISGDGAALRLGALAEVARCAPHRLPDDVPGTAIGLLAQVYAEDAPTPEPAGYSTPTLIGALREERERESRGRRAPHAAGLIGDLSRSLGARVDDRIGLCSGLLESDVWETRLDAVSPAEWLMREWRGDFNGLVRRIGELSLESEPRTATRAVNAMRYLYELAAPAADALAAGLRKAPRSAPAGAGLGVPDAWSITWPAQEEPSIGPGLEALARLGDPRALPALEWVFENAMPRWIPHGLLSGFGAGLEPLLPTIRRLLRDEHHANCHSALISALGEVGTAALDDLVGQLPKTEALRALERMGPAAAGAVPALEKLATGEDPDTAVLAARVLWAVREDPEPMLRVADRAFENEPAAVLFGLAEVGAFAGGWEGRLRALLDDGADGTNEWLARKALWRIAGDARDVLPSLLHDWDASVNARTRVAELLAELGPAAASAAPRLKAELDEPSRHTARSGLSISSAVQMDEDLLRACRKALTAIDEAETPA